MAQTAEAFWRDAAVAPTEPAGAGGDGEPVPISARSIARSAPEIASEPEPIWCIDNGSGMTVMRTSAIIAKLAAGQLDPILMREISHEPLQLRLNEIVAALVRGEGAGRQELEESREPLRALAEKARSSRVASVGMGELAERATRALTAVENWLDVDATLTAESFPEAHILQDRMRVALSRWPLPDELPERVRSLAKRVEECYESGENSKQPVL